jgi:hypothetical protein
MGNLDNQKISLDLVVNLKDTNNKSTTAYVISLTIVAIFNLIAAYIILMY